MKRLLIFLLMLGVLCANNFSQTPYLAQAEDAANPLFLARVYFSDRAELDSLAARLDVWEVHSEQGWLLAYLSMTELHSLTQSGLLTEIDTAATANLPIPTLHTGSVQSGIPGFACYRTVEETHTRLQDLVTTYPVLATLTDIGDSWEKSSPGGAAGYDLWALKLTNSATPAPKPRFFLMAAIHARELATGETALRFAEYLLTRYNTDPQITWLLDYNEIHIVPLTNPDGRKKAESGLLWRKNTNPGACSDPANWGTDLNRNFGFGWGGAGASGDACDPTYRGTSAASEPETQIIQNHIASLFPDRRGPAQTDPAPLDYEGLVITLHSYSELVLWPFGSVMTPSANHNQLQTLGRKLAYLNLYTPKQASGLYLTSGSTDDWAYGTLGTPAYTFEMGTSFFQDCPTFESTIYPRNRDALLLAFKSTRRPYQSPAGPEVLSLQLDLASAPAQTNLMLTGVGDDTRYNMTYGEESTQNIQAARYSLDAPSWIPGVVAIPMSLGTNPANPKVLTIFATLNTGTLAPGRHTVFVEAQDAAGNWGAPSAIFLEIQPTRLVQAVAPALWQGGRPGFTIIQFVNITNTGNLADRYSLSAVTTPGWGTSLATQTGELQPGQHESVPVFVTIPSGSQGLVATTQVTVQSQADSIIKATVNLTTRSQWQILLPKVSQ